MNGYLHQGYAESLAEFGSPRRLPHSGGWILARDVPGTPYRDGMGSYPLFCCENWAGLREDLEGLGSDLVSVALVADPFGGCDESYLRLCFPDLVLAYKEHFVTDLSRPRETVISKHHRYYARKALAQVEVEAVRDLAGFAEEWTGLYEHMIGKFQLRGIKAFSRAAFAKQLGIPGMAAWRAVHEGETVAAHLWFLQGAIGYSHLAASTPAGYALSAPYAIYWHVLEHFAGRAQWLDLGAAAGVASDAGSGLNFFKRGWSTHTRTAYFCGRIFDEKRYQEIVHAKGIGATTFFPAYRVGEW